MKNIKKASLIERLLSGFIDYFIIFGFIGIMLIFYGKDSSISEGGKSLTGLSALAVVIFWFIITVLSDYLFGQTLGNYTLGIKPVPKNNINRGLTFSESIKRHLCAWVDLSFVGIILIAITEDKQRLGDLWANTIVIDYKNS